MSPTPQSTSPGSAPTSDQPTPFPSSGAAQASRDTVKRVTTAAHETIDRAADAATSVADRVASSGDRLYAECRAYMNENPAKALGIAVAIGFLLGRLSR